LRAGAGGWTFGGGAVGGTWLGGVAGAVLGIAVGGGLGKAALSHPENLPKRQNEHDWMVAGVEVVDACMGVFGMLIGALVGGVAGTLGGSVAGAVFGAGATAVATGDRAPYVTEAPAPGAPRPGPDDEGERHTPAPGRRPASDGSEGTGAGPGTSGRPEAAEPPGKPMDVSRLPPYPG
jgi:hypothetical protein